MSIAHFHQIGQLGLAQQPLPKLKIDDLTGRIEYLYMIIDSKYKLKEDKFNDYIYLFLFADAVGNQTDYLITHLIE